MRPKGEGKALSRACFAAIGPWLEGLREIEEGGRKAAPDERSRPMPDREGGRGRRVYKATQGGAEAFAMSSRVYHREGRDPVQEMRCSAM